MVSYLTTLSQWAQEKKLNLATSSNMLGVEGMSTQIELFKNKQKKKLFLAAWMSRKVWLDRKVTLFNPLKCPLIIGSDPRWTNSDLERDLFL